MSTIEQHSETALFKPDMQTLGFCECFQIIEKQVSLEGLYFIQLCVETVQSKLLLITKNAFLIEKLKGLTNYPTTEMKSVPTSVRDATMH